MKDFNEPKDWTLLPNGRYKIKRQKKVMFGKDIEKMFDNMNKEILNQKHQEDEQS